MNCCFHFLGAGGNSSDKQIFVNIFFQLSRIEIQLLYLTAPMTYLGSIVFCSAAPRARVGRRTAQQPFAAAEVVVQPRGEPEHLADRILAMVAELRARRAPGPCRRVWEDRQGGVICCSYSGVKHVLPPYTVYMIHF